MRIFCLIGKSSSGKDTIFKRVINENVGLKRVVMSTTRPMRPGEVDGIDYNFVTDDQFKDALLAGNVVEHRSYSTIHGLWSYFTTASAFTGDHNFLTTSTVDAVNILREHFGIDNVVVVNIEVDDGVRLQRALTRELNGSRNFSEMCRRFLSDTDDFSKDNLSTLDNLITVHNDDLETCISDVMKILNGSD